MLQKNTHFGKRRIPSVHCVESSFSNHVYNETADFFAYIRECLGRTQDRLLSTVPLPSCHSQRRAPVALCCDLRKQKAITPLTTDEVTFSHFKIRFIVDSRCFAFRHGAAVLFVALGHHLVYCSRVCSSVGRARRSVVSQVLSSAAGLTSRHNPGNSQ